MDSNNKWSENDAKMVIFFFFCEQTEYVGKFTEQSRTIQEGQEEGSEKHKQRRPSYVFVERGVILWLVLDHCSHIFSKQHSRGRREGDRLNAYRSPKRAKMRSDWKTSHWAVAYQKQDSLSRICWHSIKVALTWLVIFVIAIAQYQNNQRHILCEC